MSDIIYYDAFGQGAVGAVVRNLVSATAGAGANVTYVAAEKVAQAFCESVQPAEGIDCINASGAKGSATWIHDKLSRRLRGYPKSGRRIRVAVEEVRHRMGKGVPAVIAFPQLIAPPRKEIPRAALLLFDVGWRAYPHNFKCPDVVDKNCAGWIQRVERIVTISEFSKKEFVEGYDLEPDRVTVMPLAAPPRKNGGDPVDDEARLRRLGLEEDSYYLYPAILRAHKGHDYLVEALQLVDPHYPVVLCGLGTDLREDPHQLPCRAFIDQVGPVLARLASKGRVYTLGAVSDADMAVLAKNARAYLLPSRYEGFGLPLVEAIDRGKPVLCSRIPPHEETVSLYGADEGVIFFDVSDAASLAALLEKDRCGDLPLNKPTVSGRADAWTWTDAAQRVIASFQDLDT